MHPKSLVAGALMAGSLAAAHDPSKPTKIVPREANAYPATTPAASVAVPSGVDPSKFSKFRSDMNSYHSKVKADPMYTSMKAVLKTAVPESYKEAMRTNPTSIHKQFETASPDWYKKLPDNVKKFMEKNQKEAKSIWEKDVGPVPTAATDKGGKKKDEKKDEKKKSEAPGMSLVGATVFAVVGAFGVAALLL